MKETIKIVENNITINVEQLKKIIMDKWQSGVLYRFYYNQGARGEQLYKRILEEIDDYADQVHYEVEENAQKRFGKPNVKLDWGDKYPKSDVRSIGFEVLSMLTFAWASSPEELIVDDIPAILEFLDTPPGKSLEAWDKWEKYWTNLDYPERRRKLLENAEK